MRPKVVRYTPTPAQKAQDARDAQAAAEIAAGAVARLMDELQGKNQDFVVLVARASIRGIALVIAKRAGVQRAIGLLSGAAAFVCPPFKAEPRARDEAEALFRKEAA